MCLCVLCRKRPCHNYLMCDCCHAPLCLWCTEFSGKVHDLGDGGDYCDDCFKVHNSRRVSALTMHDPGCPAKMVQTEGPR